MAEVPGGADLGNKEGSNMYACSYCDFKIGSLTYLKNHQNMCAERKLDGAKKGFTCAYCSRDFPTVQDCYEHTQRVHEKREEFICKHCELNFANVNDWIQHSVIPFFRCEVCQAYFTKCTDLKVHKALLHPVKAQVQVERQDKCQKDQIKVIEAEESAKHSDAGTMIVDDHTVIERHKCDYCEKVYSNDSNRVRHMKQFHVDKCNKRLPAVHVDKFTSPSLHNLYKRIQAFSPSHAQDHVEIVPEVIIEDNQNEAVEAQDLVEDDPLESQDAGRYSVSVSDVPKIMCIYKCYKCDFRTGVERYFNDHRRNNCFTTLQLYKCEGCSYECFLSETLNKNKVTKHKESCPGLVRPAELLLQKESSSSQSEHSVFIMDEFNSRDIIAKSTLVVDIKEEIIEDEEITDDDPLNDGHDLLLSPVTPDVAIKQESNAEDQVIVCSIEELLNSSSEKQNMNPTNPVCGTSYLTCPTCPVKISSQSAMNYHQRKFHPVLRPQDAWKKSDIECSIEELCNSSNDKSRFRKLVGGKKKPTVSDMTCRTCSMKFSSLNSLYTHERKFHPELRNQDAWKKCEICDFVTAEKAFLQKHMSSVHRVKMADFKCTICGLENACKNYLDKHQKRVHYDDIPDMIVLKCDRCEFRTGDTEYLLRHQQRKCDNRRSKSTRHTCDHCKKTFIVDEEFEVNLTEHMKTMHPQQKISYKYKNNKCKYCNAVFRVKRSLQTHIRRVHGTQFKCDHCDYVTGTSEYMKRHLQTEHFIFNESFKCQLCPGQFSCKKYLSAHEKCAHYEQIESLDVLSCTNANCGYKTGDNERLAYHMRLFCHFGGKKINDPATKCNYCDQWFSVSSSILKHELRFHFDKLNSDVKVYSCDACDYKVADKKYLHMHQVHCNQGWHFADEDKMTEQNDRVTRPRSSECNNAILQDDNKTEKVKVISLLKEKVTVKQAAPSKDLHQCQYCDHISFTIKSFKAHTRRNHFSKCEGMLVHSCTVCNMKTPEKFYFDDHFKKCSKDNLFLNCDYCDRQLSMNSTLLQHQVKCHSSLITKTLVDNDDVTMNNDVSISNDDGMMTTIEIHDFCEEIVAHDVKKEPTLELPNCHVYQCDNCDYKIGDKVDFERHQEVCSAEEEQIIDCNQDFSAEDDMEEVTENSTEICHCVFCGKTFYEGQKSLRKHMDRFHVDQLPNATVYECEQCGYIVGDKVYFQRHLKNCSAKDDQFSDEDQISDCNQDFSVKSDIEQGTEENSTEKIVDCSVKEDQFSVQPNEEKIIDCKQDFSAQDDMEEMTKNSSGIYCDLCCKSFVYKNSLTKHMQRFHFDQLPDVTVYECDRCGYKVGCHIYFKNHRKGCTRAKSINLAKEKRITNEAQKPEKQSVDEKSIVGFELHKCKYCEKTFRYNSKRARHQNTCSSKGDQFTDEEKIIDCNKDMEEVTENSSSYCDLCCKSLISKHSLRMHMERFHFDQLPDVTVYECDRCGYKVGCHIYFKRHREGCNRSKSINLAKEKRITNEPQEPEKQSVDEKSIVGFELHKCKYCEKSFRYNFNRARHQKACSSKGDQFTDEEKIIDCNKDFSVQDDMEEVTENSSSYCDLCCKSLTSKHSLRKHMERFHFDQLPDVTVYECDRCGYKVGCHIYFKRHRKGCTGSTSNNVVEEEKKTTIKNEPETQSDDEEMLVADVCSARGDLDEEKIVDSNMDFSSEDDLEEVTENSSEDTEKQSDDEKMIVDDDTFCAVKPSLNIATKTTTKKISSSASSSSSSSSSSLKCQKCNFIAANKIKLKFHLLRHNKNIKCEYCDTKFSKERYKKVHQLRLHIEKLKNVRVYKCKKCDYKAGRMEFLRLHQKTCVSSEKALYNCGHCHKSFSMEILVKNHLLICPIKHKKRVVLVPKILIPKLFAPNKKPQESQPSTSSSSGYKCPFNCITVVTRKDSLRKHSRNKHGGKKIFSCDKCNKVFGLGLALQQHVKKQHH